LHRTESANEKECGRTLIQWTRFSVYNKANKALSIRSLLEVATLAGVLQDFGVNKGDRVLIYMPMIPETVFAMLACARIWRAAALRRRLSRAELYDYRLAGGPLTVAWRRLTGFLT
jgi:acyl-coenzyme A synthetase/AMP-(fatty) acid ligase